MQNALRLRDEIQQFTDQHVTTLPDWETLPYDSFSPHQEIISTRLSTLYQLPNMTRGVLILPVNTLMQRVCPHSFLHGHALVLKKASVSRVISCVRSWSRQATAASIRSWSTVNMRRAVHCWISSQWGVKNPIVSISSTMKSTACACLMSIPSGR